jgi:diketogulonate reductase-like aldo/keto reductase
VLTIRDIQITVFEAARVENFKTQLASRLREVIGSAANVDTAELSSHAMERAEAYGIVTEHGVANFAALMAEEGRDFHDDPDRPIAHQILTDPDLPEEAKIVLLLGARPWRPVAQTDTLIVED